MGVPAGWPLWRPMHMLRKRTKKTYESTACSFEEIAPESPGGPKAGPVIPGHPHGVVGRSPGCLRGSPRAPNDSLRLQNVLFSCGYILFSITLKIAPRVPPRLPRGSPVISQGLAEGSQGTPRIPRWPSMSSLGAPRAPQGIPKVHPRVPKGPPRSLQDPQKVPQGSQRTPCAPPGPSLGLQVPPSEYNK